MKKSKFSKQKRCCSFIKSCKRTCSKVKSCKNHGKKNVNGKDLKLKLLKIVNVIGKHIQLKEEEKEEKDYVVK